MLVPIPAKPGARHARRPSCSHCPRYRRPKSGTLPARVLKVLAQSLVPMSATQISDALKVSRPTVESVLRPMAQQAG